MTRVWRLLGWTFALLLLAMPVVAVVNGWIGAERWPIRTLSLQAPLKLVDEATLRSTIAPMAQGGFFAVDPVAIRQSVAALRAPLTRSTPCRCVRLERQTTPPVDFRGKSFQPG